MKRPAAMVPGTLLGALLVALAQVPPGIRIGTSAQSAGAIDSLTWQGKEFLNTLERGRELQSAAAFDGLGECFHPTEAGSEADAAGPLSSSRLMQIRSGPEDLETTTDMAFWLRPGQNAARGCGSHPDMRTAANRAVRAGYLLTKNVHTGFAGMRDVLDYRVTFTVPDAHESGTFEAVTGYLAPEFSRVLAFDPGSGKLLNLSDGPGEQTLPVMVATASRDYAMGVYSPGASYGRFRFRDGVKWSCVFRPRQLTAGEYRYRSFVAVGTAEQVREDLVRLSRMPAAALR